MGGPNLDGELLSDAGITPLPADSAELSKLTSEQGVNYVSAQSLNQAGFRVDPANPRHATNREGFSAYRDEYGWRIAEDDYIRMRPAVATWIGLVRGALPPDTWTGIDAGALNIKPHAVPLPPLPLPEPHLFAPMAVPGYRRTGIQSWLQASWKWIAGGAAAAAVVVSVGTCTTEHWFSGKSENVNGSASRSLAAVPAVSLAPTATATTIAPTPTPPPPPPTATEIPPPQLPAADIVARPAPTQPPPTQPPPPPAPTPPPTPPPAVTKEASVTMSGTVGQVPPSGCDGNTQSGSPFGPLMYTLRVTGNQVTLINAAGGAIGAVVATGTLSGNSFTLAGDGSPPASGLKFSNFVGTLSGASASGSGTFRGVDPSCVIPFSFTWALNTPVN